jgi:hypothetical protein
MTPVKEVNGHLKNKCPFCNIHFSNTRTVSIPQKLPIK